MVHARCKLQQIRYEVWSQTWICLGYARLDTASHVAQTWVHRGCGRLGQCRHHLGQSACRKLSPRIPGYRDPAAEIMRLWWGQRLCSPLERGSISHFLQSEMPWPMANSEKLRTSSFSNLCLNDDRLAGIEGRWDAGASSSMEIWGEAGAHNHGPGSGCLNWKKFTLDSQQRLEETRHADVCL
jgi:hypothetical protein